jgi:hypothetical protein
MLCDGCGELVSDPIMTPWGLLCAGCQEIAMREELSIGDEHQERARKDYEGEVGADSVGARDVQQD